MLVAISIPIFTSQLEKSRDAVTLSNLRAAYAEASTTALTDGKITVEAKVTSKGTSTTDTFSTSVGEMSFTVDSALQTTLDSSAGDHDVVFTFDSSKTGKEVCTVKAK